MITATPRSARLRKAALRMALQSKVSSFVSSPGCAPRSSATLRHARPGNASLGSARLASALHSKAATIAFAATIVAGYEQTASAESFRLGHGDYIGEHRGQCRGLETHTALMHVVEHDPLIACTAETMTIQVGKSEPLPADSIDGLTARWRLNDENTMIITIDPTAKPSGVSISVGIIHRTPDIECWEKWSGDGVRQ